ncbi:hypothetical protein L9F63_000154 [Diploptera punctata]|uniref:Uncharacterized protein n=1 Tax=Diploptera punctata TaxID=6984 RepID=A0AAD8AM93_DIPPU|nr:hypothetical protein L9F63_000154 [Diploptera punctata]
MDTSNNPFASDSVPFQKPGLLLDLGAGGDVFKQNGTSPSANDLYFMDRPSNGKGNFDDDDFGPETDVDAVDDVLLSPTKIANNPKNNNPFEDDMGKRAFEADLEIQRQQTSDFDPIMETRQETPTPPADAVPGVTNLVPEPDNVAESGEDSEDEWNYFSVKPKAETEDTNQQTTQEVCEKSAEELEDEENMESRLNPMLLNLCHHQHR